MASGVLTSPRHVKGWAPAPETGEAHGRGLPPRRKVQPSPPRFCAAVTRPRVLGSVEPAAFGDPRVPPLGTPLSPFPGRLRRGADKGCGELAKGGLGEDGPSHRCPGSQMHSTPLTCCIGGCGLPRTRRLDRRGSKPPPCLRCPPLPVHGGARPDGSVRWRTGVPASWLASSSSNSHGPSPRPPPFGTKPPHRCGKLVPTLPRWFLPSWGRWCSCSVP